MDSNTPTPPRPNMPDVPLAVEDLLTQAEDLLAAGGDPLAAEELLAQVRDLQGW